MFGIRLPWRRDFEADTNHSRAEYEQAVKVHDRVVQDWPEVREEADRVRFILQENGLAPKIWEEMKRRRTWA